MTRMKRSIPPKTMSDVSRSQRKQKDRGTEARLPAGVGLRVQFGVGRRQESRKNSPSAETSFPTGLIKKKARSWKFQTKPLFQKIKGPLVDVFHEAEEVLVVIDLGSFGREDVSLKMNSQKYSISAKRGYQEFQEEITLAPDVEIEKCTEYFRNGVLEIVLTRKRERRGMRDEGRKDEG